MSEKSLYPPCQLSCELNVYGISDTEVLLALAPREAVTNIPLRKPRRGDHRQLLPQLPDTLRIIRHNHNRLLHRRPSHVGGSVYEEIGVDLSGARDAEE